MGNVTAVMSPLLSNPGFEPETQDVSIENQGDQIPPPQINTLYSIDIT